jgi:septal ring factor EnvC (AmiA/AmiB activator)
MKKFLIILVCFLPLAWSCNDSTGPDGKSTDPKDQQIEQLQKQLAAKDSSANDMFSFINEVEDNLNVVEASQMKIAESKKGNVEANTDVKESIKEHIQNINTLLEKNKELIAKLEKALRKSNLKVSNLEKTIELLNQQMATKDAEIADLKVQLEKLNFTVQELSAKIVDLSTESEQKSQQIDQQTVELNTAYYVIGVKKDLKTKGIIVGDKVSQKVNPENYIKVDIRYMSEVKLNVKKAKLLTTHPEGSYEMVMNGKVIDKIAIKNAKAFWSISKFLVIQTD